MTFPNIDSIGVEDMKVKYCPLFVCFRALEHFRKSPRESRHGYVNVDERVIEFKPQALSCAECQGLLDEIDVSSRFG